MLPSQPAGTYSGQVKFILLHPSTADKISPDINTAFYNANKSTVSVLDSETGEYGNFYKMQDMDSGICGSVIQDGDITTAKLVDIRDNNLYYVTKLKDGNCWMTQNLALDLEATPTNVAPLTSENTDLNDNSLSGAYELGYTYENNVLTWKPANATRSFTGTSVSGWTQSNTVPSSARKTDGILAGHTATGNHYNWSAAIASNNSGNYSSSTYSDVSKNPQNSICPKGWRLPTVSSVAANNEFAKLNNLYNSNSTTSDAELIVSPLWFTKSGFIGGTYFITAPTAIIGPIQAGTIAGDTISVSIVMQLIQSAKTPPIMAITTNETVGLSAVSPANSTKNLPVITGRF